MKRYVILSVNENPEYLYYVPLVCWAWRQVGWEPIVMYLGSMDNPCFEIQWKYNGSAFNVWGIKKIEGYRDDTVIQVARLYAACSIAESSYLMTSDIDMLPLSDFWNPDINERTVYGHDLADNRHYPICYIGMNDKEWRNVMKLDSTDISKMMRRDLAKMPQAKDSDFYKYWFTDQDLITDKLGDFTTKSILRGKLPNGLARGRVDRGGWSLNHEVLIDAHLHRDLYKAFQNPGHEHFQLYQKKWREHMELLRTVWPNEDWGWVETYTKEFVKLAQ